MTLDLTTIKAKQQATWATGDYASVAAMIVPVAESLVETADLRAGWRVLDVATGSGNAAIAAARRNTRVTGLDYVPALLDRARQRAAAEGLNIEWVEGDAENLPFPDGAFDAVLSVFGSMFAPDHQRTAGEMARVCRRGGRIALACWTPSGFIGEMFKLSARYNPPPPGLQSPLHWGTEPHLAQLFSGAARITSARPRTFIFRHTSAEAYVDHFCSRFGPMIRTIEAAGPAKAAELRREFIDLVNRFDQIKEPGGPIAVPGEYLETILERT